MQSNNHEIEQILYNSATPVESLEAHISNKIKRNDRNWAIVLGLSGVMFIGFYSVNRPDRREVLAQAKVTIDSIRIAYQLRLDVITDSLFLDNYKPHK